MTKAAFHPYGITLNLPDGDVILNAGQNMTILPQGKMITFSAVNSVGVSSINSLSGSVDLVAGSNVTLAPSGNSIAISATNSGTVTSVTFSGDGVILSSTPSTAVTSSGTLTAALLTQLAHTVLAGPASGTAAPTFRQLATGDISGLYTPATGDLTAQSAAVSSVVSVTSPNDGNKHQYQIGVYANITAISLDVLVVQATYTDENGNAQTVSFFPMGLTSANLASVGAFSFPDTTIRVNPNTVITIKTSLTTGTGSITYDVGGSITRIN